MSEKDIRLAKRGRLVLKIDNQQPIRLSNLAAVFDALSRDYKQATGEEIAVEEIRQGSIVVILRDISDWADQANHLFDFAKNLATVLATAVSTIAVVLSRRQKGAKTVLALAKLAMDAKAEVRMDYKGPAGDQLILNVTPGQGRRVHEREVTKVVQSAPSLKLPVDAGEIERIAIAATEQPTGFLPPVQDTDSSSGLLTLLEAMIAFTRRQPGGRRFLNEMAGRLRSQGHYGAADLLER
jgi:hypothetical protein